VSKNLLENIFEEVFVQGNYGAQLKIPMPFVAVATTGEWDRVKQENLSDHFHFRVKNLRNELRLTEDIQIYSELIERFYH
jgi:hypothetical protein